MLSRAPPHVLRRQAQRSRTYPSSKRRSQGRRGKLYKSVRPRADNHFFKRTYTQEVSTSSGIVALAREWQLALLPNYTEITALFDQYRINCVVVRVIWRSSNVTMFETNNNNSVGMPIMYDVIDQDDSTAPGSAADIQQYGQHHISAFSANQRVITRKVLPRTANTVYRTGATSAYGAARRGQWIDSTYADVPYYGWKAFIDIPQGGGTSVEAHFDLHFTVYFQGRKSR